MRYSNVSIVKDVLFGCFLPSFVVKKRSNVRYSNVSIVKYVIFSCLCPQICDVLVKYVLSKTLLVSNSSYMNDFTPFPC